eukprot:scaffold186_cov21-Tisochrysis_lutea.AAC.3
MNACSLQWAVGAILGPACTVAEPVELGNAFPMSSATMPIVLISSTDQPLPQLMLFAEQQVVKVQGFLIRARCAWHGAP